MIWDTYVWVVGWWSWIAFWCGVVAGWPLGLALFLLYCYVVNHKVNR